MVFGRITAQSKLEEHDHADENRRPRVTIQNDIKTRPWRNGKRNTVRRATGFLLIAARVAAALSRVVVAAVINAAVAGR